MTKLFETSLNVRVIGLFHYICFILCFFAFEAVTEYSQNAEEKVTVKQLCLGEDKLYLRVRNYFKLK